MNTEEVMQHPWFAIVDWNATIQKQLIPPFKPIVQSELDTQNFDPVV
jgi:protein-serine/threonine kinase